VEPTATVLSVYGHKSSRKEVMLTQKTKGTREWMIVSSRRWLTNKEVLKTGWRQYVLPLATVRRCIKTAIQTMFSGINRGSQSVGGSENESKERRDHSGKSVEQQRSASREIKREANGLRRGFIFSPHTPQII